MEDEEPPSESVDDAVDPPELSTLGQVTEQEVEAETDSLDVEDLFTDEEVGLDD